MAEQAETIINPHKRGKAIIKGKTINILNTIEDKDVHLASELAPEMKKFGTLHVYKKWAVLPLPNNEAMWIELR